jgi:hypothetical protein
MPLSDIPRLQHGKNKKNIKNKNNAGLNESSQEIK